jgi:hypothetical protein
MKITTALDDQIDQRMACQRLEHVIKEPDAGFNPGLTAAVKIDPDAEISFLGMPTYFACPGHG